MSIARRIAAACLASACLVVSACSSDRAGEGSDAGVTLAGPVEASPSNGAAPDGDASGSASTSPSPPSGGDATATGGPDSPGPPVNGDDPNTPPWGATPPLPPNTSGVSDPALADVPPPVPSELDSSAGRVAYRFMIAFFQAYLSRESWQDEWEERWAPFADSGMRSNADDLAVEYWTFAAPGASVPALDVYSPRVIHVVASNGNGDPNASALMWDITIARQCAVTNTGVTNSDQSLIATYRIVVAVNDGAPLVTSLAESTIPKNGGE